MARFSFGIFGQDSNALLSGLLVKIKDVNKGIFVASTAPEGEQLRVYDNNDGTYYVDGLPSGMYSVYVNSDTNVQEELQNIVFLNEEMLEHVLDETIHRKINDGGSGAGDLWSASKIQSELDVKANQGELELLEAEVSGKADMVHSHDYLAATQVSSDFVIEGGVLKYKPSFASESILREDKTLNQNLELLQGAIRGLESTSGKARQIYIDQVVNFTPTGGLDFPVYSVASQEYVDLVLLPYAKQFGENRLRLIFEAKYSDEPSGLFGSVKLSFGTLENVLVIDNVEGYFRRYDIELGDLEEFSPSPVYDVRVRAKTTNPNVSLLIRKVQVIVD